MAYFARCDISNGAKKCLFKRGAASFRLGLEGQTNELELSHGRKRPKIAGV